MYENRLVICVSKDATTCLMLDVVRGTDRLLPFMPVNTNGLLGKLAYTS